MSVIRVVSILRVRSSVPSAATSGQVADILLSSNGTNQGPFGLLTGTARRWMPNDINDLLTLLTAERLFAADPDDDGQFIGVLAFGDNDPLGSLFGLGEPASNFDPAVLEHFEQSAKSLSDSDLVKCKTCTVCLENLEAAESGIVLPCSHVFHKDCLLPWLQLHATCPVCRLRLSCAESEARQQQVQSQETSSSQLVRPPFPFATTPPFEPPPVMNETSTSIQAQLLRALGPPTFTISTGGPSVVIRPGGRGFGGSNIPPTSDEAIEVDAEENPSECDSDSSSPSSDDDEDGHYGGSFRRDREYFAALQGVSSYESRFQDSTSRISGANNQAGGSRRESNPSARAPPTGGNSISNWSTSTSSSTVSRNGSLSRINPLTRFGSSSNALATSTSSSIRRQSVTGSSSSNSSSTSTSNTPTICTPSTSTRPALATSGVSPAQHNSSLVSSSNSVTSEEFSPGPRGRDVRTSSSFSSSLSPGVDVLSQWNISVLKQQLRRRHVDYSAVCEKAELVQLLHSCYHLPLY